MVRRARRRRAQPKAKPRHARKLPMDDGAKARDLEKRLAETLEQQTAAAEILRVISRSPTNVQPVFEAIVHSASRLCNGEYAIATQFDGELVHLVAQYNARPGAEDAVARLFPLRPERNSSTGRAILSRAIVHVTDAEDDPDYAPAIVRAAGLRSVLTVPMLRDGEPIGTVGVSRAAPGGFPESQVELMKTFADQAVIAIENVRLFKELEARNREIEDKGRQLEAASRHKSEFLANMSHELRTPLHAVIGFSEVLVERVFGALNEKQEEYLKDIYASGQHLLSLINDILDLSKIEAGRMELERTDFDVPAAIDNALTLMRERAGRHGITLRRHIDDQVGRIWADERKVKQILLNLLSNAIKFTPDGGRIDLRAALNEQLLEVSVADTGVGIAPEDQEAVFEEFRQVGTASKKVEGTGLGLALSQRFVELHGGRIWVKSQLGVGSTFTFTLPLQCDK